MRNGLVAKQTKDGLGIPISRIETIANGTVDPSRIGYSTEISADNAEPYRLRCGDILFSHINSASHLGKTAIYRGVPDLLFHGMNLLLLRANEQLVTPSFLQLALRFLRLNGTFSLVAQHAVNQASINQKKLSDLCISLAPLAEQKRVADKVELLLNRVDALGARLDRVPALLKRFRQSVLAAATSGKLTEEWREKNEVEYEWREIRLGEIAEVQGGVTKDSKKQSSDDEEVPYLRVANVQRGHIDLSEVKSIRIPASKLPALLLREGDVLFNEGGDLDKLGRGWVWESQISKCSYQNHVFRARLNNCGDQPKYISWWGNSRGLEYFIRSGKQTTNLASINKSMLCNLPISLPSPPEQQEIVRRVEALFAFADRIESRLADARKTVERLTPATLAKAFRGELVPQDPADEPAAVLLERIGSERGPSTPAKRGRGRRPASA